MKLATIVIFLSAIGISHAADWRAVTKERTLGTVYKNDTSAPIDISVQTYSGCIVGVGPTECNPIFVNSKPMHCAVSIRVEGVLVDYQFQNAPRENSMCSAKAVIPPGAQYVVGADGWEDIFLFNWAELR